MQREIKFRGKRLDNGEWVYGFLIQYENGWFICNFIGDAYQYEVDPSTVGQFTGLKDKNGKEIYEGDVVRIDDLYDPGKTTYPNILGCPAGKIELCPRCGD